MKYQLKTMFGSAQGSLLWDAAFAKGNIEMNATTEQRHLIRTAIKNALTGRLDCSSTEFGVTEDNSAKINYEERVIEVGKTEASEFKNKTKSDISNAISDAFTETITEAKRLEILNLNKELQDKLKKIDQPRERILLANAQAAANNANIPNTGNPWMPIQPVPPPANVPLETNRIRQNYRIQRSEIESSFKRMKQIGKKLPLLAKLFGDTFFDKATEAISKYTEYSSHNLYEILAEASKALTPEFNADEVADKMKQIQEKLETQIKEIMDLSTSSTLKKASQLRLALRQAMISMRTLSESQIIRSDTLGNRVNMVIKLMTIILEEDIIYLNNGKPIDPEDQLILEKNDVSKSEKFKQAEFLKAVQIWNDLSIKPAKRICGYELVAGTPVQVSWPTNASTARVPEYPGWNDDTLLEIKNEFLEPGTIESGDSRKRKLEQESASVAYDGVGRIQSAWFTKARFKAYMQGVDRKRKAGNPTVTDFDYTGTDQYANVDPIPIYEETACSYPKEERTSEQCDVIRLAALCISGESKSVKFWEPDPLAGMDLNDRYKLLNGGLEIDDDALAEIEKMPPPIAAKVYAAANIQNIINTTYGNLTKQQVFAALAASANEIKSIYKTAIQESTTGYYFSLTADLESQHQLSDAVGLDVQFNANKAQGYLQSFSSLLNDWSVYLVGESKAGIKFTDWNYISRFITFGTAFSEKARHIDHHVNRYHNWKENFIRDNRHQTSSCLQPDDWKRVLAMSDNELITYVCPDYFLHATRKSAHYVPWAHEKQSIKEEIDLSIWKNNPAVTASRLPFAPETKSFAKDIKTFIARVMACTNHYVTTIGRNNPFGYNNWGQTQSGSSVALHRRFSAGLRSVNSSFNERPGYIAHRDSTRSKNVGMCVFSVKPYGLRDPDTEAVFSSHAVPCGFSEAVIEPISTDEVTASLNLAEGISNLQSIFETTDNAFVKNVTKEFKDLQENQDENDKFDIILVPVEQTAARSDKEVYINESKNEWLLGATPSLLTCAAHVAVAYLNDEYTKARDKYRYENEHAFVFDYFNAHIAANEQISALELQEKVYKLPTNEYTNIVKKLNAAAFTLRMTSFEDTEENPLFALSQATLNEIGNADTIDINLVLAMMLSQTLSDKSNYVTTPTSKTLTYILPTIDGGKLYSIKLLDFRTPKRHIDQIQIFSATWKTLAIHFTAYALVQYAIQSGRLNPASASLISTILGGIIAGETGTAAASALFETELSLLATPSRYDTIFRILNSAAVFTTLISVISPT
ncbi:MAG: hypothetical protein CMO80_25215 [Verrucomicrobiales bacterium]|nr:hypothetical protein [Verrucomicrobiales bacterium]